MNNKEVLTTDNELHDLIVPTVTEVHNEDDHYGTSRPTEDKPYDGWAGFPGCGDGQDDFQDYNQNEGRDW